MALISGGFDRKVDDLNRTAGLKKISYSGYRFPSEIIYQAIWLYVRFTLSFRDVEDLLAEHGIMVSHGAPSTPSARSSMCWSRAGGTSGWR